VDEYEHTYYMDSDSFVTNRRVNLAGVQYDLADIRWVGVEEQVAGLRLGNLVLPSRPTILLTSFAAASVLYFVLVRVLPDGVDIVGGWFIYAAAWGLQYLVYNWLDKRGQRDFLLGVSGAFGVQYPITSKEGERLRQIAEAIKHAMRDRYASLQQSKPPADSGKRTSTLTR
jgi:hypothetical protein